MFFKIYIYICSVYIFRASSLTSVLCLYCLNAHLLVGGRRSLLSGGQKASVLIMREELQLMKPWETPPRFHRHLAFCLDSPRIAGVSRDVYTCVCVYINIYILPVCFTVFLNPPVRCVWRGGGGGHTPVQLQGELHLLCSLKW